MISDEIKRKSSELGISVSTLEKDYAISWMLYGIWKSGLWKQLAFKGGTSIKKVYFGEYRFSEDLDYTLLRGMESDVFEELLHKAVNFANDGPVEFMSPEIKKRAGVKLHPGKTLGFQIKIPFRLLSKTGVSPRIKMDVTLEKYEEILLPLQDRPIIHIYSDFPRFKMVRARTYALEEIFAEKVRSLFQRTRPRDLYDVWKLREFIDLTKVLRVLPLKFKVKGVEPSLNLLRNRREYYLRAWESSLGHQLRELPDFDRVWGDTLMFLEDLMERI
ncbi:CRISPR-associated protein Csx11 [Thermococcus celericrescens]|uniref:CRISPR-associated protein Csx11 n=1 Tax=Thermococcus celericrescens TaxID=227598 RepID=A0A100XYR3_9EURY|nr:nucleotidyl transferase AbiEii/AbiGii toxin family protein [Thermococcus celericrescens]KUH34012.1 CRISPR-associated protein Csx11 [Thermococcus celericrescens]